MEMERESNMRRPPLPDGRTPVYRAAANGDVREIRALRSRGANVDEASRTGATPVYIAAANGHARAISVLKEEGANVNTPNRNGTTPLYIAAFNGQVEAVHVLLDVGADASIMTREETALTCARRGQAPGHPIVVQLLEAHFEHYPSGVMSEDETIASRDEWLDVENHDVSDVDSNASSMSIAGNRAYQELAQANINIMLEQSIARIEQENDTLSNSTTEQALQQTNGLHQVNDLSVRFEMLTRQFEAMREAKEVAEREAQEQIALRVAESTISAEREAANKLELERIHATLATTNQALAEIRTAAQITVTERARLAAFDQAAQRRKCK